MDIAIIGTGNMARGIASRLVAGGHSVRLLGTQAQKAEAVADELSGDVRAGKSNTTFAGTLAEGTVAGQPLGVFLASDDDDAKATVGQLVGDGGLRPVDAGPLRRARELEALGYLHMAIQQPLGTGFGSAVKVVS